MPPRLPTLLIVTEIEGGRTPGWYTDPAPANRAMPTTMRFWDGRGWTAQTRAATRQELRDWRDSEQLRRRHEAVAWMQEQDRLAATVPSAVTAPGYGAAVPSGVPVDVPVGAPVAEQPGAPAAPGLPQQWSSRATTPDGQPLSGWWRRYFAVAIDAVLIDLVAVVAGWGFLRQLVDTFQVAGADAQAAAAQGLPQPDPAQYEPDIVVALLGAWAVWKVVGALYEIGFVKAFNATPGKLLVGIEVRRRSDPGVLSWGTVLARWAMWRLVPWVPLAGTVYAVLDGLWPLWDANRQALHDKVTGTQVVRRGYY